MARLFPLFLSLALLCGCAVPVGGAVTTNASPTPPSTAPTLTPTRTAHTETPTATEVPVPAELQNLPPNATAESNGDGTWKIVMKSGDQTEALGTFNPETGYTITLSDGTSVNVPIAEIGNFKAGQDTPFQIYNKTGDRITYAYDAENKAWVEHDKVIQSDYSNKENFIKTSTWDDLKNLNRLEKMFMLPFLPDTYFPPLDQINKNYLKSGEINANPLGYLADLSKTPTRFVNFIILEKGEDRQEDYFVVTEQVFNPADDTFSSLHFLEIADELGIKIMMQFVPNPNNYFLPLYKFGEKDNIAANYQRLGAIFDTWIDKGYYTFGQREFTGIKSMMDTWLTSGKVPEGLEEIVLFKFPCNYSINYHQ